MVNKSALKALLTSAIFSLLMFSAQATASPVIGGLVSEGMLICQPEKFVPRVTAVQQNDQSFFGTLGPETSAPGSVKTYSLKVVSKSHSSDRSKVLKNGQNGFDDAQKCLLMPVSGRVSSLFGKRRHPTRDSWHFHSGIDIVAPKGTAIFAAKSGKVTYSGWKRGYGMVVIVDHGDDMETVYAHCSKVQVKNGQSVNGGQRIASVGSTGVATGSHLHFEVRRGGNVRNPFRYLRK